MAETADKIDFDYKCFPDTVYVDSEETLKVCLVNQGGAGDLIYNDQIEGCEDCVTIDIPIGSTPNCLWDLIYQFGGPFIPSFTCSSLDPLWECLPISDYIFYPKQKFLFHPIYDPMELEPGKVSITEGQIICFEIKPFDDTFMCPIPINSKPGVASISVFPNFNQGRVKNSNNTIINVFKTKADGAIYTETDPKVQSSTLNSIPKWNNSELIDSGIIEDSEGRVGIGTGTNTPDAKLHIVASTDSSPIYSSMLNIECSPYSGPAGNTGIEILGKGFGWDGISISGIEDDGYSINGGDRGFYSAGSEYGLGITNSGNHSIIMSDIGGDGIHVDSATGWAGYF